LVKVIATKIPEYDLKKIRNFLEQAFSLIPDKKKIRPGERVLIKPNFLWPKPVESAVCTHPAIILETCKFIIDLGANPVIGDSPSRGSAKLVAEKIGLTPLAKRIGAEIINFASKKRVEIKNHLYFSYLDLSQEALEFDKIINLAKFKTHAFLLLTLAVKNLFGLVPGSRKPKYHLECAHKPRLFALLLLEIYNFFSPCLSIIDGIVAMQGNGPNNGEPRKLGILLASTDAIALDRIGGELVYLPFEHNLTAFLGTEYGVGIGKLQEIELEGIRLEDVRVKDFIFPHPGAPEPEKIPRLVRWFFKEQANWRPVFDHQKCTLCGACVEICPAGALAFVANKKSPAKKIISIDRKKCINCFCCQEVCPSGAIRSERGRVAKLLMR